MIRVLLVDDQPELRRITRRLISRHPEIAVVGEAADGVEALEVVAQARPDVVLMDLHMPILDGVATTKHLRIAYPEVQIVLFTTADQDSYVAEGLRAGAAGYVLKTTRQDLLVAALRAARKGDSATCSLRSYSSGYLASHSPLG